MKCNNVGTDCQKPAEHNVHCPHCDLTRGACAEHIANQSRVVEAHLKAEHPDSTMPALHA
jgi:hypothetical protein